VTNGENEDEGKVKTRKTVMNKTKEKNSIGCTHSNESKEGRETKMET
jgi:hypothetical protein